MVYIAGGAFRMGSERSYYGESISATDAKPIHTVTVSSFFMDKTEVTQAEYRRVMGKNPSNFSGCDDCPVEKVSWHDANAYAQKVGKRLPTEAEWEYAARGGNKSKGYMYSGSNDLYAVGWYKGNVYRHGAAPVAEKKPNELGLYDMSGNVKEWCADWKGSYIRIPQTDPQGPSSGEYRVVRGGSWDSWTRRHGEPMTSSPDYDVSCRVGLRYGQHPDRSSNDCGSRLVVTGDTQD